MSLSFCTSRLFACAFVMAGLSVALPVEGALLALDGAQRIETVVTVPVNLTTAGNLDWAYWSPASATEVAPLVAPTNEKAAGSAIGGLGIVGGTGLRGSSSSTTVERYSWTDGTAPATGTTASLAGLMFNSQTGNNANGKGWQLSIVGDPAQERLVTLYLGGFAATGNLTVTLNGVDPLTAASTAYPNSAPKQMDVYTLRFQPDSVGDLLVVQYTASNITDTVNGHVGLQAVTVGVVPEPGTAGLLFLGCLALCQRRRS